MGLVFYFHFPFSCSMSRFPFHVLFFPGMIFHEVSHYLACLLFGVRVRRVKFFGFTEAYVIHEQPDAFRAIIITLAPFILGTWFAWILIEFGLKILRSLNPFGFLFYWFALSLLFYSFPSLEDSKNAFNSFTRFYGKRLFGRGSIFGKLLWFITFPFIFIPFVIILGVMLAFNYSRILRILWVIFILVLSFNPMYVADFFSLINQTGREISSFFLS